MSNLTDRILRSIDYEGIRLKRRENYRILNEQLQNDNLIKLRFNEDSVAMVYPYFSNDKNMRNKLIEKKIFIAKYWKNVLEWCNSGSFEYEFVEKLLPLPIDQRYSEADMLKIIGLIRDKNI
jgi:dTDP-4-amino-4,6-dideoxygalactose transaminase